MISSRSRSGRREAQEQARITFGRALQLRAWQRGMPVKALEEQARTGAGALSRCIDGTVAMPVDRLLSVSLALGVMPWRMIEMVYIPVYQEDKLFDPPPGTAAKKKGAK